MFVSFPPSASGWCTMAKATSARSLRATLCLPLWPGTTASSPGPPAAASTSVVSSSMHPCCLLSNKPTLKWSSTGKDQKWVLLHAKSSQRKLHIPLVKFTHLLSQVFFGQCNHPWICTKGTNYFDGLLTFIYKNDLYLLGNLLETNLAEDECQHQTAEVKLLQMQLMRTRSTKCTFFKQFFPPSVQKVILVLGLRTCNFRASCLSLHSVHFWSKACQTNQLQMQLQPEYILLAWQQQ